MSKSVLVFDPGENTGWIYRDEDGKLIGGTSVRDHRDVAQLIFKYAPDVVVFERFNLYPGLAQSMSWNTFYPCEVIGVIKYICMLEAIELVEQSPSDKRYSGGLDARWMTFRKNAEVTEHTKDAYLHLRFYERKHAART